MTTTQTAAATAPVYTTPDTYVGRWMRDGIPAGYRAETWAARELAAFAHEGIVWEFSGHTRAGKPLFVRTRYIADAVGALHCYDSTGRRVIVHPADRNIRILVK